MIANVNAVDVVSTIGTNAMYVTGAIATDVIVVKKIICAPVAGMIGDLIAKIFVNHRLIIQIVVIIFAITSTRNKNTFYLIIRQIRELRMFRYGFYLFYQLHY